MSRRSSNMDYQQSVKNFDILKNFVCVLKDYHIFFFFTSDTEYKVKFYESDLSEEELKRIEDHRISGLAYGFMNNEKSGVEALNYFDSNVYIEYDIFSESFVSFDCHDPINMELVSVQFLQLIEVLKNK